MRALKNHAKALGYCTYCPKLCRFCCPTAEVEHRETVTPWFKMTLAEMVRSGRLEAAGENAEVFLHCLGCLHCRTHCKHENDVPAALIAARSTCLEQGAEDPSIAAVLDLFRDTGNPWGEDLAGALRGSVDGKYFVPEAQAVVFAGCQAIRAAQDHLEPLFSLFESLGVEHVGIYHGGDLCCGAPLWQAGDFDAFSAHARRLSTRLAGVRQVICPCPTCAYVLGGLFSTFDVQLSTSVVTVDDFLAPLLKDRPPVRRVPGQWVFHDPCYLTRYLERPDGVRRLVAQVLEGPLLESNWNRDNAGCCGGGGLVPHTLPKVASGAALARIEQLCAGGADSVVTACPGCVRRLGSVSDGPPVKDYVELLRRAYR